MRNMYIHMTSQATEHEAWSVLHVNHKASVLCMPRAPACTSQLIPLEIRPETIKSYRCLEEELDTKARTLTVQHLELDAPTLEAEEWLCRSGGDEALGIESRTSRDQHGGVPGQGSYPPKCNVNVREAVSYMPEPAHLAAMQNAAGRNPVEFSSLVELSY